MQKQNGIRYRIPEKNLVMDVLNEGELRLLQNAGTPNGFSRSVYCDADYLVVHQQLALCVWFSVTRSSHANDDGEIVEINKTGPDKPCPTGTIAGIQRIPEIRMGPRLTIERKKFRSLVLVLGHDSRTESIVSLHVIHKSRMGIVAITSSGWLSVFSNSGPAEISILGTRAFHVEVHLKLHQLMQPNSARFHSNTEAEPESVFVTDAKTDRVCEIRFDHSILSVPRSCPEISIVYWRLESGLAISPKCQVTLVADAEDLSNPPFVQIVGSQNNADSQGLVRLLNAHPSSYFFSDRPGARYMESVGGWLLVNSASSFRILKDDNFDFPLFLRCSVRMAKAFEFSGEVTILVCLNGGVVKCFELQNKAIGKVHLCEIPSNSPIGSVDSFQILKHVSVEGELDSVSLSIDREGAVSALLLERTQLTPKLASGVVRSGSLVVCPRMDDVLREVSSNFSAELEFDQVVSSEDWVALLTVRTLFFVPFASPKCVHEICIPESRAVGTISFTRVFGKLILCGIEDTLIVKRHLPYDGAVWTTLSRVCGRDNSVMTISEVSDCMYLLEKSTGQVSHQQLPSSLVGLLKEANTIPLTHPFSIVQEKLLTAGNFEPTCSDLGRSADGPAQRFLLNWTLVRSNPEIAQLSTEDIAWAGISDTQDYLTTELLRGAEPTTWEFVRRTGIPLWGKELGKLKEIAELLQKASLQEYLRRSKDAGVLEERVALWLAILGKQQLLVSLYKQHGSSCASAVHTRVGEFLGSNFSVPEMAEKGVRNAFELVKQKRHFLAVAVFLLAGAVQEAVDICCRQLADWQLAMFLLKVLSLRSPDTASLVDQLWDSRLCPAMTEAGDVWIPALRGARDMAKLAAGVEEVFVTRGGAAGCRIEIGAFRIKARQVSRTGFVEFANHVLAIRKRIDKSIDLPLWTVSETDTAWELHQVGLSALAKKLFRNSALPPALKWAINVSSN